MTMQAQPAARRGAAAGVGLRRRKGRALHRAGASIVAPASSAALVALLELAVRTGLVDQESLPAPTQVLSALYGLLGEPAFWDSVWNTLQGWVLGLALAVAVAVPAGIAIGSSRFLQRSVRALVEFLRPIPAVALLPLFLLLFSGIELKAYLVAVGAFWPMLVQTLYGMADLDPVATDTARAYRLRRRDRFALVVLPGTSPYIATGLRISATLALVVAVALEIVVGTAEGVGASLVRAQQSLQIPEMYAYVVVTGVLGLLVGFAFRRLERWTLAWHPSQRGEAS